MASACNESLNGARNDKNRNVDRAEVEAFIGAPLPSSATNVQGEWQLGIDDLLMLKFTMPETDIEPFLRELGFDLPLRNLYRPFFDSGEYGDWWRTDQLTKFQGGAINLPDKTYELIVDTSSPDKVTLYLMVYER